MKSQAIEDIPAQFLKEKEFLLDDEVPGEVATVEVTIAEWTMRFGGSSTANSEGIGIVLYHGEGETMALLFKLEFPCSISTTEYEAYIMGLVVVLKMGVQHLRVISDSNLVVYQVKGSFSLKEPSLAPYRTLV